MYIAVIFRIFQPLLGEFSCHEIPVRTAMRRWPPEQVKAPWIRRTCKGKVGGPLPGPTMGLKPPGLFKYLVTHFLQAIYRGYNGYNLPIL